MLFTVDFYKKYNPEASERRLVHIGRIATAVVVILGIAWIPIMRGMGQVLYAYLQDVQSLLAPGIAAVFFLGVFWQGATAMGGLAGLTVGFVLGMIRLFSRIFETSFDPNGVYYHWMIATNWLHYCIFLFLLCLLTIVVVSQFTPSLARSSYRISPTAPARLSNAPRPALAGITGM
ncbi:MAG: hypothetical protein R2748_31405 [Bryobacterales bacterium]